MKGLCIAFSMYSKIPVPTVEWNEKNQKYAICYFPLVGAVIGLFSFGWYRLCELLRAAGGEPAKGFCVAGLLAIPILVTGGIHIDGFMDTSDARHSYGDKARKLEILKDAHIGAFAVIRLLLYFILLYGGMCQLTEEKQVRAMVLCYILSRTLSGMAVVTFPAAKKTGTLYAFSSHAHKRAVRIVLAVYLAALSGVLLFADGVWGALILLGNGLLFFYYYRMALREFGGITGDLAGWFLQLSELVSCLIIGIWPFILLLCGK